MGLCGLLRVASAPVWCVCSFCLALLYVLLCVFLKSLWQLQMKIQLSFLLLLNWLVHTLSDVYEHQIMCLLYFSLFSRQSITCWCLHFLISDLLYHLIYIVILFFQSIRGNLFRKLRRGKKRSLELRSEKSKGNRPGEERGEGKGEGLSQEGDCTCILLLIKKKKNLEKF